MCLPYFLSGTAIGYLWDSHLKVLCKNYSLQVNAVAVICLILTLVNPFTRFYPICTDTNSRMARNRFNPEHYASYLALVVCAAAGCRSMQFLVLPPLQFLGKISFGLYLIHSLVIWGIEVKLGVGVGQFCLLLAIVFALATASFYLIEQPAQRCVRLFALHVSNQHSSLI